MSRCTPSQERFTQRIGSRAWPDRALRWTARLAAALLLSGLLEPGALAQESGTDPSTETQADSPVAATSIDAADGKAPSPLGSEDAEAEYEVHPDPGSRATEDDPNWLARALAREAELLPQIPISSPNGLFSSSAPAVLVAAPESHDLGDFFQLSIGTQAPVECWVMPDDKDLAALLRKFSESNFAQMAGSSSELEARAIERVRSGSFGRHPHLGVDWLYRVRSAQGSLAGFLKLRAATVTGTTVFCQHNELGYRGSFERVFQSVVENLESTAPKPPDPYYLEVVAVKIGGRPLGYTELWFTFDADGDTRIDKRSALLVPVDTSTLRAQDSLSIQYSTPDGTLINQVEVEAENGELATHMTLIPDASGWQAEGLFQGQPSSVTLRPQFLTSLLGEVLRRRHLVSGESTSQGFSHVSWEATLDPASFFEKVTELGERTEEGQQVLMTVGDSTLEGIAGDDGHLDSVAMTVGENPVTLERIFHLGRVPGGEGTTP